MRVALGEGDASVENKNRFRASLPGNRHCQSPRPLIDDNFFFVDYLAVTV
jgi:hypothetical protein